MRQHASSAGERLAAIDVELARTDAEHAEAERRLAAANAEPAEGTDRPEFAEKLDRYERRREQLGQVNPLAKEEYEAEKERLQELAVQRADLEASLERAREATRRPDEDGRDAIRRDLRCRRAAFPRSRCDPVPRRRGPSAHDGGRRGRRGIRHRGRAAPGGQARHAAVAVSGGEKALGAIAFLFSLFLARPARSICSTRSRPRSTIRTSGASELLRTYADRAQFIVITHQKRTMEAADVLYGVTMGPDGVSQIVSRRLPRDEVAATA